MKMYVNIQLKSVDYLKPVGYNKLYLLFMVEYFFWRGGVTRLSFYEKNFV